MRGQIGIGSLLIFLATIVVAVIAAGVFITTATSLQQKAFATGSEAKERVSASVDIESITGVKDPGVDNRTIHEITLGVKLAPGADPIKLDDNGTFIQIITPEWQVLRIVYGGVVYGSGIFPTVPKEETFYVWANQSVDRDGYMSILSPGELYTFVIKLNSTHTIKEEMPIIIKVVSRTGMSSEVKFRAPTVIKDPIVTLYP